MVKIPFSLTLTFSICSFQEDGPHAKRSSSPPQGAPRKRTAFIDITNVSLVSGGKAFAVCCMHASFFLHLLD